MKEGILSGLFQIKISVESLIKEGGWSPKKYEENRNFRFHFGEVGFIGFLRLIQFLTAFV